MSEDEFSSGSNQLEGVAVSENGNAIFSLSKGSFERLVTLYNNIIYKLKIKDQEE